MSFGVYLSFGVVFFSLGILPLLEFSRWWSVIGYLVGAFLSIPVRAIISNFFCVPYIEEETGFQKYIRRIEKNEQTKE